MKSLASISVSSETNICLKSQTFRIVNWEKRNFLWLINSSQEQPAKKAEAKQDSESKIYVYGERADETRSDGNDKFELLKTEGQPGWMEKLLKKVSLYYFYIL